MTTRGGLHPVDFTVEEDVNVVTVDRFERRLAEECG